MGEKIKAFFQKKPVKIVCGVAFAAGTAGLIIGGVTHETLAGGVVIVGAAVAAVGAVGTFIAALVKGGK